LRYAAERFLARLAKSRHGNRFVLKGAMLFVAWNLDEGRTTRDLDFSSSGTPDPNELGEIIAEVCQTECDNDGIHFDPQEIRATTIREDAIYDGMRLVVPASIGTMRVNLQIDVGFGDSIVPPAGHVEFPPLLHTHGPSIPAYPPESVVAEKLHVLVQLGIANSRMKDYYDLWMLSENVLFSGDTLGQAIAHTFRRRQTPVPRAIPVGLSAEFAAHTMKNEQWGGFLRRQGQDVHATPLPEVVDAIGRFLIPVLDALAEDKPLPSTWTPHVGW
jgi:predicted nucleotidyltransferase component of viral defense system